jgi:hypothetical protein
MPPSSQRARSPVVRRRKGITAFRAPPHKSTPTRDSPATTTVSLPRWAIRQRIRAGRRACKRRGAVVGLDPQESPGLFSVSRWFREQWQTGPDHDRQRQNTRSALAEVCAGQGWFCLVSGGAPGRIRTCDTRFRKSCVVDKYACYQRLQFAKPRTTALLGHGSCPVRTTTRTTTQWSTMHRPTSTRHGAGSNRRASDSRSNRMVHVCHECGEGLRCR